MFITVICRKKRIEHLKMETPINEFEKESSTKLVVVDGADVDDYVLIDKTERRAHICW